MNKRVPSLIVTLLAIVCFASPSVEASNHDNDNMLHKVMSAAGAMVHGTFVAAGEVTKGGLHAAGRVVSATGEAVNGVGKGTEETMKQVFPGDVYEVKGTLFGRRVMMLKTESLFGPVMRSYWIEEGGQLRLLQGAEGAGPFGSLAEALGRYGAAKARRADETHISVSGVSGAAAGAAAGATSSSRNNNVNSNRNSLRNSNRNSNSNRSTNVNLNRNRQNNQQGQAQTQGTIGGNHSNDGIN